MACELSDGVLCVAESLQMLQKHLQCGICLEIVQDPAITHCGHTFCRLCIDRLFSGQKTVCPLCNAALKRRGIRAHDQLERIAKAVLQIISAAQKDASGIGVEDILQLGRKHKSSSREALSPCRQVDASNEANTNVPGKTSKRVETWLSGMHSPSLTQESSASVHVDASPDEESDGEMISVSQIDASSRVSGQLQNDHLSGHIEEDGDGQSDEEGKRKRVIPKKRRDLKVKPKQDSSKTVLCQANPSTKPGLSSTRTKNCELSVPEPVLVVLDTEKENTSNVLPTRSPGWSRVQRMKKDLHEPSKLVQIVNSKRNQSPAPSLEYIGSADEEPCLSLSLDSPVLRKKAKVNEIVNNLESEIQSFEKFGFSKPHIVKEKSENLAQKYKYCKISHQPPEGSRVFIEFLKLGSLVPKINPQVPFYLKGCLQHMAYDIIANNPFRMLQDAQTQTSTQTPVDSCVPESNARDVLPSNCPTQAMKSPRIRRSRGMFSDVMDAETVLYSQLSQQNGVSIERADSYQSIPGEFELQSQRSESIIFSQNFANSPKRKTNLENAQNTVMSEDYNDLITSDIGELKSQQELILFSQNFANSPKKKTDPKAAQSTVTLEDSDDSAASDVGELKSKRRRTCLSDSSDSDIVVSKRQSKKHKKSKSRVLSDNEDSLQADPNSLPEISILDMSLPDSEGQAKLKADIEADLIMDEKKQGTNWKSQESMNNNTQNYVQNGDASDESVTQVDSDDDSEVFSPKRQKAAFLSHTTQSDDIVPSSQPAVAVSIATLRSALPGSETSDIGATEVLSQAITAQETGIENEDKVCETKDEPSSNVAPPPSSSSESLPSVSKEPPTAKPSFVCSNLPPSLVSQVEKLANVVGGEFSAKFSESTSHLVVRVDEENKADKTLKYLSCIAAGKWVVSFQWVRKCLEAGKLLPEEPYEALDTSGEPGPRRSREARSAGKNLFKDFEFCCMGEFPDLSKKQLEALLIDCGAVVVNELTDFSSRDSVIPVTLAQWDEEKDQEFSSWLERYNSPLVQHEWVLDCIGKFSVTSFYNMLLCDAPEDVLLKMGIPAYLLESNETE